MKRESIRQGCTYTDGKGNHRTVVEMKEYGAGLIYVVAARTTSRLPVRSEHNTLTSSFAKWAHRLVRGART